MINFLLFAFVINTCNVLLEEHRWRSASLWLKPSGQIDLGMYTMRVEVTSIKLLFAFLVWQWFDMKHKACRSLISSNFWTLAFQHFGHYRKAHRVYNYNTWGFEFWHCTRCHILVQGSFVFYLRFQIWFWNLSSLLLHICL